jgi:hypothetical protein
LWHFRVSEPAIFTKKKRGIEDGMKEKFLKIYTQKHVFVRFGSQLQREIVKNEMAR